MKKHSEKDGLPEMITAAVSVLLILSVILTNSAGSVSLTAAKVMFNAGNKVQTHTVIMPETSQTTEATTQTVVSSASTKSVLPKNPSS